MGPITWTEKGYGLVLALADAGLAVIHRDGSTVSSDPVAAQAIIDAYTLEQAKAYRKSEVDALSKRKRDAIVEPYSVGELAVWAIKEMEAKAYQQNPSAGGAPLLAAEAAARGISTSAVVTRVLANAAAFRAAEADISGRAGAHKDAIDALQSFAAINAYNIEAGW